MPCVGPNTDRADCIGGSLILCLDIFLCELICFRPSDAIEGSEKSVNIYFDTVLSNYYFENKL